MKFFVFTVLAALAVANPVPQAPALTATGTVLSKNIQDIVSNALKIVQDILVSNSAGVQADVNGIVSAALAIPKSLTPLIDAGGAKAAATPKGKRLVRWGQNRVTQLD